MLISLQAWLSLWFGAYWDIDSALLHGQRWWGIKDFHALYCTFRINVIKAESTRDILHYFTQFNTTAMNSFFNKCSVSTTSTSTCTNTAAKSVTIKA